MMKWLDQHHGAIQALAGLLTFCVAIAALIGVKVQIDAAERTQREQSARDIYREFLNLSIAQPDLAKPNYCAIIEPKQRVAYENYVTYMLYASEQILDALPDWEATINGHLTNHRDILCSERGWAGDTPEMKAVLGGFRARQCKGYVAPCGGDDQELKGN
jgi:hypothetical protein